MTAIIGSGSISRRGLSYLASRQQLAAAVVSPVITGRVNRMSSIVAFEQQPKWGSIIAGISIALICVATLTPEAGAPPGGPTPSCERWCDSPLVADFIRNIILFAPMGFGLRLAGVRALRAILAGTLLSATVETLQIRVIAGRDASVLDWISNTLGTMSGVVLAARLRLLLLPLPRQAFRLTILALFLWVAALSLGAWGIQPAAPEFSYWGQRVPRLRQYPPFRGELISARVDEIEMPSARLAEDDGIRRSLGTGQLRVEAIVRPGLPSPKAEIAPIVRVVDEKQREILLLGRGGQELVLRYRLRATSAHLETPAFALAGVFDSGAALNQGEAEPAESLYATLDAGRLTLTARGRHGIRQQTFELTAASAWSFLLPWEYWYGGNAAGLSLFWLAVLLVPAGYWGARTIKEPRTRSKALALAVIVVPTTVAVLPRVFELAPATAAQFIAAFSGIIAGAILAALLARGEVHDPLTTTPTYLTAEEEQS